jgi:hypothetical protein
VWCRSHPVADVAEVVNPHPNCTRVHSEAPGGGVATGLDLGFLAGEAVATGVHFGAPFVGVTRNIGEIGPEFRETAVTAITF